MLTRILELIAVPGKVIQVFENKHVIEFIIIPGAKKRGSSGEFVGKA
jgi:hypothetical protein